MAFSVKFVVIFFVIVSCIKQSSSQFDFPFFFVCISVFFSAGFETEWPSKLARSFNAAVWFFFFLSSMQNRCFKSHKWSFTSFPLNGLNLMKRRLRTIPHCSAPSHSFFPSISREDFVFATDKLKSPFFFFQRQDHFFFFFSDWQRISFPFSVFTCAHRSYFLHERFRDTYTREFCT